MKFSIKELGKIKSADFEVKDLTIFVGKNSTNKSYATNVVYKLNKVLYELDSWFFIISDDNLFENYLNKNQNFLQEVKLLKRKEKFINKEIENDTNKTKTPFLIEVEFKLEENEKLIDNVIKSMTEYLDNVLLIKINQCFNSNISIIKNINLVISNIDINKIKKFGIRHSVNKDINLTFLENIFKYILNLYKEHLVAVYEYYFPASRTGFVLALDEIVSGLSRGYGMKNNSTTKLTEATVDFVSQFMDIKLGRFKENSKVINIKDNENNSKIKELLIFIEQRLIHGKIIQSRSDEEFSNFYLQTDSKKNIELHLSSSATLELLPLVAFLKRFSTLEDKFLIIEEPEAHLHPQAQIEMARLLVMLVNAGAKVLVTTHSDYIISEISNCIKLSNVNKNEQIVYLKKYNLNSDIIISQNNVSTYLFKDNKNEVEVKELKIDSFGINNENFDEVLDELLDRTQEINESIEG